MEFSGDLEGEKMETVKWAQARNDEDEGKRKGGRLFPHSPLVFFYICIFFFISA